MSKKPKTPGWIRFRQSQNTIRRQLVWGNVGIAVLIFFTGVILLWQINRLNNAVHLLQLTQARALAALEVSQNSTQLLATVSRVLPLEDADLFQNDVSVVLNDLQKSYTDLQILNSNLQENDTLYSYFNQVSNEIDGLLAIGNTMVRQSAQKQWPSVRVRVGVLLRDQQQLVNDTGRLVDATRVTQANAVQQVRVIRTNVIIYTMLALVIAIVVTSWLTGRLTTYVANPIARLTTAATAIAGGNLARRVTITVQNEVGQLAQAFNTMADRLQDFINTLEFRIQERTRALEVSVEISSQITMIQDKNELLEYVVNRIQMGYNFYHTQIYLVEPESGDLVLAMGYGDLGRRMRAQNHRLPMGNGIVGTVASTNQSFQSNNVDEALNFVPHPLLPYTKSELAVPLRVGDEVVGVLDIQSEQLNRFKPEDVTLMQSLADQTAVALQNIRLLEEMKLTLQKVEHLNQQLTRTVWDEFGAEITTSGYRFRGGQNAAIVPDSDAWLPAMSAAARRKKLVQYTEDQNNGQRQKGELAVPLTLRGEVIGFMGIAREQSPNWSEEEIAAVEAVANQVTMALENARLSQEQAKTIVRLKEVDHLKSNFLASMSHELRTPLNSIIGFADILLQGIDGELSENAITDIAAIHNSGKHLLALINDILDLSKIEAGRMELAHSAVSVPDLFTDVSASVSSLLIDKSIELVQQVEPELPRIWADPLRISQVVINLVSNAIKFTEEGTVTLGAAPYNPGFIHIYVQDTGIGIPEDKFQLVFEHFRQVDARNNRKYQGSGMGLAISRQLVQLHGGEMWLDSVVGQGSTFHFTVPIAEPDRDGDRERDREVEPAK